jgi:hypothetical protein
MSRFSPQADPTPTVGIELSVRLTNGAFESRITLPVGSTPEQRLALTSAWFKLMEEALAMCKVPEEIK